ncbi:hypothetical protein A2Z33_06555 [Candidatus Gottesmanbacteria bacterium RBG_16_52_11]|uniref:Bacterial bifunctional deaminase-reductase C-terminal domain-containing protein n=1 Tax=Candidatus Gottesmanbacteria bacterium RBG_16_52_11 TaxID=1798374 RepID=A0A1F5YXK2_9BACT|nr:MAG: hypothetical protein A2Z33_06555 [Candidatus Gottesmanbacteria bacterium RBG_16_52_11]
MHCTLILVSSLNGMIADAEGRRLNWTSEEDKRFFARIRDRHRLIVMGRKTYDAVRSSLSLSPARLRVVLTRHPDTFRSHYVAGQLEFTDAGPEKLVAEYAGRGYRKMLLTGGSTTAGSFLSKNLIDEIYLTIEPVIIPRGLPLITGLTDSVRLTLTQKKQLNRRGTCLYRFRVVPGHT